MGLAQSWTRLKWLSSSSSPKRSLTDTARGQQNAARSTHFSRIFSLSYLLLFKPIIFQACMTRVPLPHHYHHHCHHHRDHPGEDWEEGGPVSPSHKPWVSWEILHKLGREGNGQEVWNSWGGRQVHMKSQHRVLLESPALSLRPWVLEWDGGSDAGSKAMTSLCPQLSSRSLLMTTRTRACLQEGSTLSPSPAGSFCCWPSDGLAPTFSQMSPRSSGCRQRRQPSCCWPMRAGRRCRRCCASSATWSMRWKRIRWRPWTWPCVWPPPSSTWIYWRKKAPPGGFFSIRMLILNQVFPRAT